MNNNAIEVNDKYCIIETDDEIRVLETSSPTMNFINLLDLENYLEEQENVLKKLKHQYVDAKDNVNFYSLFNLISLIITILVILNFGVISPVSAPLLMFFYSSFTTIKNLIKRQKLKHEIPNLEVIINNIQSNLDGFKNKNRVKEKNINYALDDKRNNDEFSKYRELREFATSYMKMNGEKIEKVKKLVIK